MTRTEKGPVQRALHCRCGRAKIVARGLLRDLLHAALAGRALLRRLARSGTGPLRPTLLDVPEAEAGQAHPRRASPGAGPFEIRVHAHALPRLPRQGDPHRVLRADRPPLLRTLWREQHPGAHEQGQLDFRAPVPALATAPLSADGEEGN